MSFGFSIGDIILLTQLTTRAYNGWKDACGKYTGITSDLAVLQTLLLRIQAEVEAPNSLFSQQSDDIKGWKTISKSCISVVKELEDILKKYRSLSSSRSKNWDRIRMGNKALDGLSAQLTKRIASLAAFASVLGISSQGRLENEAFPKLLEKIDGIAAQMRKGNGTASTALSAFENDDKEVWREFRRDMISSGIRSSDIRKYSSALKTYITRLQREGLLDEEVPVTPSEETVAQPEQTTFSQKCGEEFAKTNEDEPRKNQSSSQNLPHSQSKVSKKSARAESEVETRKKRFEIEQPDALFAMDRLAGLYASQGPLENPEVLHRQIMEMEINILGSEHPLTLDSKRNLGFNLLKLSRFPEAEQICRNQVQLQSRILGTEHPQTLRSRRNLMWAYLGQKKYKEAEYLATQIIEARKRVYGAEHLRTLRTEHILALVYLFQNRYKEAEDIAKQTMEAQKRALGAEHPHTLRSGDLLADIYLHQSRDKEAENIAKQTIEARKRVLGEKNVGTLQSMHILARIYSFQSRRGNEAEKIWSCIRATSTEVLGLTAADVVKLDVPEILTLMRKKEASY